MPKDLFATVPEFLAAFDNILKNGFFEEIQFSAYGMGGKISFCSITAKGCVPNNSKYAATGCGAVIDPHTIIASCRNLAEQKQVKTVATTVETVDWPLWNRQGEKIIGSKGQYTKMSATIFFKI